VIKHKPTMMLFRVGSVRHLLALPVLFYFSASTLLVLAEEKILKGHTILENVKSPLPYTYLKPDQLPQAFSWGNVNGRSYLTHSLNQHIPQYCGSCWAHSALSSLADRMRIAADDSSADEYNLSVQFLLNCGANIAGSCHGGSATGAYQFIQFHGYIPYDTCQPYLACSSDSQEGICPHVDTTCTAENICRSCSLPGSKNATCEAVTTFPNATLAEYGSYRYQVFETRAEIFLRGPVKASVDAGPLINYTGGVMWDAPEYRSVTHNHGVSIVGWGYDPDYQKQYWIVRNSWGQYWGEMGYFRIEMNLNLLMIESNIAWATPESFSVASRRSSRETRHYYVDPSRDAQIVQRRLRGDV
jgi:cathepsin X